MTVTGEAGGNVTDPTARTATAAGGAAPFGPAEVARLVAQVVCSPRPTTVTVRTPTTGDVLAELPVSSPADVDLAYDGARDVQRSWAQLPPSTRSQIVLRFHDLVLDHIDDLLDLVQLESGKTRLHAFEEIVHVAQVARHYARTAERTLRRRRHPGLIPGLTDVIEIHHPKGVVGVVSPWNYPLSMGITDVLPALLAGNAVVLRPDPQASLTALYAADLLRRAGLPPRVLQVVLGDGPTTGAAVLDRADHVCFTGSTETGRSVAEAAGRRLVGASLELGGKNPMYVAADADLDRAVEGALRACFSSAGQLCVSVERLYVHDTVADEFLGRFAAAAQAMRLGVGLDWNADMGSLVSASQLERVAGHVDDAVAKGARVLAGGRPRPDVGPWVYAPTVLEGVTSDMACFRDETFGPVVACTRVGSDAEAVARANDTVYGLNASVWTRDLVRGRAIAAAIRAGSVNVNEGYGASFASVAAPMGGMKDSGIGRRHGADGILRFTEAQTIAAQRVMGLGVPAGSTAERYAGLLTGALRVVRAVGLR